MAGSLPEVGRHYCGVELFNLLRMTVRYAARFAGQLGIEIIRFGVSVMPQQGANFVHMTVFPPYLSFGNQFEQPVVAGGF